MIETVDALVKTSERIASYGKGAQAIILKEAKDITDACSRNPGLD